MTNDAKCFASPVIPVDHSVQSRFWASIDKTDGCWLWKGYRVRKGYGRIYIGGLSVSAHRFAWKMLRGEIPDGLVIDHLCRVRNCVNPWHMELVTPYENNRRGLSLSALNIEKQFCKNGHEFTPENTYLTQYKNRKVHRACRECHRQSERRRYARNKECR